MDRFSPVAPAYTRVLVLPVGKIERSSFLDFVVRLQNEASIVKLAEVEPYIGDDDEVLLSPNAFPQGSLLYNYTPAVPNQQHEQLSPFELFREPLLVLGIVDRRTEQHEGNENELEAAAQYLRERHPRVVHRQLVLLEDSEDGHIQAANSTIRVQSAGDVGSPALKEAVCCVSVQFLTELGTYTRAMQASPSVQTPGQTARSLQRTSSNRDQERRPASGHSTPAHSTETSSPVDDSGSRPPPLNRGSPATSFDQIPSASSVASGISRSDSRASKHTGRASSQDRVSVQGFGSGTSQDKLKHRGKARVGIVIGSIYMMAGQWGEALRVLVENTNKARMLSDHIWHAKGLENIIVCLLLHSWAGLEFQIPSICYPIAERTSSAHVQRFSVNLPTDFRPADAAQQASVRRLSTSLPDLLKLVLSLYRSVEGPLELPFVSISEATVRFCKLLAVLHNANSELDHSTLDQFIGSSKVSDAELKRVTSSNVQPGSLSKAAIADMVSHARPMSDDSVPVADQVAILAGTASVYSLLQMYRKKANVLKDMVTKLTAALIQARKRGAAEMGIHPAASLSTETGAEAIFAITEDSGGIDQMMSEIAGIYGIKLTDPSAAESEEIGRSFFGCDNLKAGVLMELAAFCEASPDPYGVLRLNTTLLSALGINGAVDTETDASTTVLSKDDQVRLTTTISRTIGVSKHLGIPQVEAKYWDRFLVRGIAFVPSSPTEAIVDRSKLSSAANVGEQGTTDGNPLLYDPNAKNRPGTSADSKTHILVENEVSICLVTLQNPNEVSVDIDSLSLTTEGVELETSHEPITLNPMRLQQVSLSVSPCSVGDCRITGCRVKISGCVEQVFLIIHKPWSPSPPTLVKELGQDSRLADSSSQSQQGLGPESTTVFAKVIEAQPSLALENSSLLESSMMLLDGEKKDLSVVVRNTSRISLSIFDVVTTNNALRLQTSSSGDESAAVGFSGLTEPVVVEPGDEHKITFLATGRPSVAQIQIAIYYSRHDDDGQHARLLSVPIEMTVNAAVQVQHLNAMPLPEEGGSDSCVLSFDIRNAWPKTLSYAAAINTQREQSPKQDGVLAPGEIQRVYLPMRRLDADIHSPVGAGSTREALLGRLHVTWSGEGRLGEVDVSGLSMSPETLEQVSGTPLQLSLQLLDSSETSTGSMLGAKPTARAGSFVTLRAKTTNQAKLTGPLFVQLHSRALTSIDSAQDERRMAVAGAMHRIVPPLLEGGEATVDFSVCPLIAGMLELEVVAKAALAKDNGRATARSISLVVV